MVIDLSPVGDLHGAAEIAAALRREAAAVNQNDLIDELLEEFWSDKTRGMKDALTHALRGYKLVKL